MTDLRRLRFVVAEPILPSALDRLRGLGDVEELADPAPAALAAAISQADALIVRSKTHVTARVLEAAQRLRVIGRAAASVDHIDLRVARERNIDVVYAPHAADRALTEFTVAMILAIHRRLTYYDRHFRAGAYEALRQPEVYELGHLTLGLLGINRVAVSVGRIFSGAFGCRVLVSDPAGSEGPVLVGESVGLEELLKGSDILSIHLSLTTETRGFLNSQRLALLRPTAKIVNVTRGGVVDTNAVSEMLKTRRLAGAAFDVFEAEPLPAGHPLRNAPNCLLTPHIGACTRDVPEAAVDVVEDVLRVLRGERPLHSVQMSEERPGGG